MPRGLLDWTWLEEYPAVMDNLLPATTHEGKDWDDCLVYDRIVGQWARELGHVTQIVGAFESFEKHGGQEGVRFNLIPKERQVAAVKFLNANAFATPVMLLRPEVLRRIEPAGALTRIRSAQLQVLNSLMSAQRFDRLVEQEAVDGPKAYRPAEFLADVRKGIFGEMYSPSVKIDAYRRNLQRAYLDLMSTRLNGAQRANDDQRPMFRGELKTISADAGVALARATDRDTRLHLEDLRDQIAKILDPKYQQANPTPLPPVLTPLSGRDDIFCWTDYGIGVESNGKGANACAAWQSGVAQAFSLCMVDYQVRLKPNIPTDVIQHAAGIHRAPARSRLFGTG
jgi:hypothetical protein